LAENESPNLTDFQQWEATPETPEADGEKPKAETVPASEPGKKQDAEPEAKADGDEDDEDLPKGLKKRFRKLTGKIRDLEAQLVQKTAAPEAKPAVATPPAPSKQNTGRPELAKFETYEDYVEALADWKIEQREVKRTQADAVKQNQTAWEKKIEAAKAKLEDWDEVVSTATDIPVTAAMQQAIFEMEQGPLVVHYLASHPDEAKRIAKLTPLSQARELGKIEDRVSTTAEPEKKPAVSQAPRPPRTVSGSSGNDSTREPDPADFAKWSKWKDRQERAANGE
jgi:hypothetical protein